MGSKNNFALLLTLAVMLCGVVPARAADYTIGAYYFPGWHSQSDYWRDLQGLPGSRSSDKPWPELEPLLGFGYAEESVAVMEKQLNWAADYGLDYFAFDWYWAGNAPYLNHAITAYLQADNQKKLDFCLMWANHSAVPTSLEQFTGMVDYWLKNYMTNPQYLRVDGKPVVIVFSPKQLRDSAAGFGKTTRELLETARQMAVRSGLPGIHFVATSYAMASWAKSELPAEGYDALTAYNYHSAGFSGEFNRQIPAATSYYELLEGFQGQWRWILANSDLPYIVPMTSGWDKRPWGSNTPHDNCRSTPESFREMLLAGREMMDKYPEKTRRMGIIYAWNEFGEGGYIMPTKKWGFQYLQAVKDVFGP